MKKRGGFKLTKAVGSIQMGQASLTQKPLHARIARFMGYNREYGQFYKGFIMPGPWIPDMSEWDVVIDLGSKKDMDNYLQVGWKFIEERTELNDNFAVRIWRLGWPKNAGEPIRPDITNDDSDVQKPFSDN